MKETILSLDLGSSQIATAVANIENNSINVLGFAVTKSLGVKKGTIINFEELYYSIENSINEAKKAIDIKIDRVIVTIPSKDCLNIKSSGQVTVPENKITRRDINQVLQISSYNATIPNEYEIIQVIPRDFTVNNSVLKNPLNQTANRLESQVNIIVAKKNVISNLTNILNKMDYLNISFVLDSYAMLFDVAKEENKKHGVCTINLCAETSNFICFKENMFLYNNYFLVGTNNITNDLSLMLGIPYEIANKLKYSFGSLIEKYSHLQSSENFIHLEELEITINPLNIQTIVHARVEELLILIRKRLKESAYIDSINSGIILSGGLSKLPGIEHLAKRVFEGIPLYLSNSYTLDKKYTNIEESYLCNAFGAINYLANFENRFELDSNKKLLSNSSLREEKTKELETINKLNQEDMILTPLEDKKESIFSKYYNKLLRLF